MEGSTIVDPALVREFQERGFVVVPDLLTLDELSRYRPVVAAAVAERTAEDDRRLEERTRYEQSFVQCQNLWEDHPEVRPLTFHPRVAQAAAELLGAPSVRLWHDQALVKEPGGRETDAHQDQAYWPIAEPETLTAWIPFDGSTLASGAMGYVPGSHRIGMRRFVNIFRGEPENLLARPELEGREPEFVEVPAGSIAFHHGLSAHLAQPNATDRGRTDHPIIYCADGCPRGPDDPHPAVDRPAIAVGAPIASDVTPVAWPRPAGDLPTRPVEPWPEPRNPKHRVPGLYPRP